MDRFKRLHASKKLTGDVRIHNPKYFNPKWLQDATILYQKGSHWQTLIALLSRAWMKSEMKLSHADMDVLVADLDAHWNYYLSAKYVGEDIERAIANAMKQISVHKKFDQPTDRELRAAIKRMKQGKSR